MMRRELTGRHRARAWSGEQWYYRMLRLFEGIEDDAGSKEFGENHRGIFAGKPDEVEGDGATLVGGELGGNAGILVGPVGAKGGDFFVGKRLEDLGGTKDEFLVGLASGAPAGSEIDVDDPVLGS